MNAVLKPAAPAAESRFALIPIGALVESKTNPRRTFDKDRLAELAESIKAQGVVQPIVVRPDGEGAFEIVAGARRYRASKAAGCETVPAIVRELTDEAVLEIQTIENLQREDVHPLEEAEGYHLLMSRTGQDVATIAAKVGKSESYVYQRLKLTALTDKAKKAFVEGAITAGHAILIARLQPKEQKEALEASTRDWDPMSVRDLAEWIDEEIHLDLNAVAFAKDDAKLLPKAGACTLCEKRTGYHPALFADIAKKDCCTDPACFKAKVAAHLATTQKELKAAGTALVEISTNYGKRGVDKFLSASEYVKAGNKTCEHTKTGLVVDGNGRGTTFPVCTNAKCRVHHKAAAAPKTATASAARKEANAKVEKELAAARMKQEATELAERRALLLLFKTFQKRPTIGLEELRVAAEKLSWEIIEELLPPFCEHHGIKPESGYGAHGAGVRRAIARCKSLTQMHELLLGLTALDACSNNDGDFIALAKRHKVDMAKLTKAALAELQAKAAEKEKPKAKPKGKKVQTSAKTKKARRA